jgi:hypothetical protein
LVQVSLHIVNALPLYFLGNPDHIIDVLLLDGLDELLVVLESPLREARVEEREELCF